MQCVVNIQRGLLGSTVLLCDVQEGFIYLWAGLGAGGSAGRAGVCGGATQYDPLLHAFRASRWLTQMGPSSGSDANTAYRLTGQIFLFTI